MALAGHRTAIEAINILSPSNYDRLLFSGPADVRLILLGLPPGWAAIPKIAYFHESQWIYPADTLDRIPHLVNHLETVEACDAVWFNSQFHKNVFYTAALEHPSETVRRLAGTIMPDHWFKARIIYPPVQVTERAASPEAPVSIVWSARWEHEKRPDLMIQIIRRVQESGVEVRLIILGTPVEKWQQDQRLDPGIRKLIDPTSGFVDRDTYETTLSLADIWISTSDHEFFGISAIEAAMLGATPVVPAGLAYPETLPSAFSYPAGDVDAAARCVIAASQVGRSFRGPWCFDAQRFDYRQAIRRFDEAVSMVAAVK